MLQFNEDFSYEDAIDLLEQHNRKGTSLYQLTNGSIDERSLMESFLWETRIRMAKLHKLEDFKEQIINDLSENFGAPCSYSPIENYMLEQGCCWDCGGNIPDNECWRRYIERKFTKFFKEIDHDDKGDSPVYGVF